MSMKHIEFMRLTQSTKSLTEYLHAFNNLSRYATEFVDTDAKNIASFKRGLSPKLMKTLANSKCATFNEFVSDALTQENQNNIYSTSKSCKRAYEAVHLSQKLLLLWDLSSAHLLQSIDHLRRRYRPARPIKCIARPFLLPYQRLAQDKKAPAFHLATCHARTTARLPLGKKLPLSQ